MLPLPAGREASSGVGSPPYVRHRTARTLLYQLVEKYYPALKAHLAARGAELQGYVEQEFEDYLKCGRLEHGFLRFRCDSCHAEHIVAFSCKGRVFCPSCAVDAPRNWTHQGIPIPRPQCHNAMISKKMVGPPGLEPDDVLMTSDGEVCSGP